MPTLQTKVSFNGLALFPCKGAVLFTYTSSPNVIRIGSFDGLYFWEGIDINNEFLWSNLKQLKKNDYEKLKLLFKHCHFSNIHQWAAIPQSTKELQLKTS